MRLLALPLILCLAGAATAQAVYFAVPLSGAEEVPPVVTTGTGLAFVVVDPANNFVSVEGNYSNLESDAIAAHIHGPAPHGRNADIILPLMPSGGTSGFLVGSGAVAPALIQDILSGLAYVNVHTSGHTDGEIRGQIDAQDGTGTQGIAPPGLTGEARPGQTIHVDCPGTGMKFVVVGLALPPGSPPMPLDIPELCAPRPAYVATDLAGPVIAFPGSPVDIMFPSPFPDVDLLVHCATITTNGCISLSGARRIAVRQ